VLWLRYHFDDDDTLTYYEFGGDGCALRQVDLQGSEQRPVTAATLEEVLHARDHGGFDAVVAYERKYGVITEGNLDGWRDVDQVVEISSTEFEQAWRPARRALDQTG
jgi:hypothetical protein